MRQRRVSLDVLDFSLLIIDQYPNNNNIGLDTRAVTRKTPTCLVLGDKNQVQFLELTSPFR
jgi:hypothetical protein